MIIKGKAHKFGDDINTDDIISAKYLVSTDSKELGSHCMEAIAPDFTKKVSSGDIIVAGNNFGCGSSREHAPMAIKGCGVAAVLAKSFAAIFFRNAINIGLAVIPSVEASENINDGDELEVNLDKGEIKDITAGRTFAINPVPEFIREIISSGGYINHTRKKLNI